MKTDREKRDLDDAPSEDELRAAERLRAALETDDAAHDDVALGQALRSAMSPDALEPARHDVLLERASRTARERARFANQRRAWRAAGILALAASVALAVGIQGETRAPEARATGFEVRSTEPLFEAPFARGQKSAHVDRIARARSSEWRDNRFRTWGVR